MQRREFIRNCTLTAAALTAGAAGRVFARESLPAVGREGWSGPAFERLKNETFRVRADSGTQALLLAEVSHERGNGVEFASLLFSGKSASRLREGTHHFSHPALGEMPIFVVPNKSSGEVCSYRATFSRFV